MATKAALSPIAKARLFFIIKRHVVLETSKASLNGIDSGRWLPFSGHHATVKRARNHATNEAEPKNFPSDSLSAKKGSWIYKGKILPDGSREITLAPIRDSVVLLD
jgi:hypothetical protein